ncbi:hypothetical protein PMPD1_0131 [Paramixta manurensis]|uniref:Uncharacterized protein n=1 Tax=Paramixta manurensis TaxID=2740817 RepID=A0A6M8U6J0_9GAMM|nr:hypothetical protein PMPD1_0131 [Erwiniaceae bacterium PD-1]
MGGLTTTVMDSIKSILVSVARNISLLHHTGTLLARNSILGELAGRQLYCDRNGL